MRDLPTRIFAAYASFILLGMYAGLLGLAWPSMRAEFGLEVDAAGVLLLLSTMGYLTGSFVTGPLAARIGSGNMFILGAALMFFGLAGFAIASTWVLIIITGFIASLGSGFIDAGLNAYVAAGYSARVMNWLHACFGVGITIGPLVMTAALSAGSWRTGYAVTAAYAILITAGLVLLRDSWKNVPQQAGGLASVKRVAALETLRLPQVWIGIAVFFLLVGVESVPGQWAYSLFTEMRAMSIEAAGFWVSLYWASFTLGRMVFGTINITLPRITLIRLGLAFSMLGALLLWLNPLQIGGVVGLLLLGFAQAPLFPILVLETSNRLGASHAENAIGFQVAGAGLSIAILPGLVGVLAREINLEVLGPATLAIVLATAALYEVMARIRAPHALTAASSPVLGD
ncbi:MAG: MFS transporter [Aggregatilineales bacterium]